MTDYNIADKIAKSYTDTTRGSSLEFSQRVIYGDTALNDSFGRLRTSLPESVFDNYEIQAKKTLFWSENSIGTTVCTHVANQSAIQFSTSMTSGNKVTRSSKKLSLYTPGTSLMVLATGILGVGAVGHSQRIGFFDASNGIFCEMKDQIVGFVVRTNTSGTPSNNRVAQSDWNIDTMDGNGPSGVNLDFTKTQIFWFDLEWLGVGRVRCGFVHNGQIYVCHEFYHNNALSTVYMSTPLLPVTYEIENTAAIPAALTDFRQICCAVLREGGDSTTHKHRNVNNGITARTTTSTAGIPVISIRIQTAYIGKAMIHPTDLAVLTQGIKDHLFEVVYNGTLAGASFVSAPTGVAAYDVTATAITGGTRLGALYTSGSDRFAHDLFDKIFWLGGEITGTADTLSIVSRALTGVTTGTVVASMDYSEIY
jgi:hypothetical protein